MRFSQPLGISRDLPTAFPSLSVLFMGFTYALIVFFCLVCFRGGRFFSVAGSEEKKALRGARGGKGVQRDVGAGVGVVLGCVTPSLQEYPASCQPHSLLPPINGVFMCLGCVFLPIVLLGGRVFFRCWIRRRKGTTRCWGWKRGPQMTRSRKLTENWP